MKDNYINAKKVKELITGIVAGAVSGFLGAGGGVFAVLLFKRFVKLEPQEAHASAVAVMLPITVISAIIYITNGAAEIRLSLGISLGSAIGGIAAGLLLKRTGKSILNKLFGALMILTGIWMLL
ncbi:MAG TPA: sulfite exporter TauE/SafE family protein [Clostridia bacterium]|nr:sulfite exporter TauE/SafE family protein [Clostridia bacterium]